MPDLPHPTESRDRLIHDHLGLVRAIAVKVRETRPGSLDVEDLIAWGQSGLVEAAQRFDVSRGVSFSTFAYYRIRGAIFDGLRAQSEVPRRGHERFRESADAYLENVAGRAGPEGAASGQDRVADLADTLSDLAAIYVTSLASQFEQDPRDPAAPDGLDALARKQATAAVRQAVQGLPEKERRLVEMHYFQDVPLKDAGETMGLSKSWTSRLHARAVRLMAKRLRHLRE